MVFFPVKRSIMAILPTLFVCITCNTDGVERAGGAGQQLYNAAQKDLCSVARVQAVQCLGGCDKACTVAVSAPEKCTLVFTDLHRDHTPEIKTYLQQYAASSFGLVAKADRPPPLRDNVLVRVPPYGWESDDSKLK
jgi:predicted metal-binding protein